MMKIDVSYEALLQALVEAIRDERDHGAAMMGLVSRLVEDGCQQDWFEAHWKTNARLRLAQMACGRMPKDWRSAAPVLEVIAEGVRWALKADEIDSESRAILLAIMRLADVERRVQKVTAPKPRHVAKSARRRKANGAGAVRSGRRAAQAARPAASPQAMAGHNAGPTAAKIAPARKVKRAKPARRRQRRRSREGPPAGDDPEDPADGKDRCGAQGEAFEAGEPDSDAGAARQGCGLGEGDDPEDPADCDQDRCGAQGQAFEAGEPTDAGAARQGSASAQAAIRKIRPTAKTAAARKASVQLVSDSAGAARQGCGLGEGGDPEDPADGKDRCGAQGQAFEAGEPDSDAGAARYSFGAIASGTGRQGAGTCPDRAGAQAERCRPGEHQARDASHRDVTATCWRDQMLEVETQAAGGRPQPAPA